MRNPDVDNHFSPELAQLILSCIYEPVGEEQTSKISSSRLLSLARWHNVRPSLLAAVNSFPEEWIGLLRQECLEITLSNLINTRETMRLSSLLEAEGISAFGYKGSLWAEWLYGQQGQREYGDIDLLIGQKDYLQALRLVGEAGYEADSYRQYLLNGPISLRDAFFRTDYHVPMLRREEGSSLEFVLEMHWRVAYPRLKFYFPESEWSVFQQKSTIQSGSILSFSNEYQLLLLVMHHGGKEKWLKLKYLADLAAYLNRYGSKTDWSLVEKLASQKGMLKLVWQGLGMLRGMGMEWKKGWPEIVPLPIHPELLRKWESMPKAAGNSSLSYFYHTLSMRDTFWQKLKIGISHLDYAFELKLLYHKLLWYSRHSK